MLKRVSIFISNFISILFQEDFCYKVGNFLKSRKNLKKYYIDLKEEELKKHKKSDTVFIMGSGYSINKLDENDIKHINQNDVFVFNGFLEHNKKIRVDYHLGREYFLADYSFDIKKSFKYGQVDYYFSYKFNTQNNCKNAILFIQDDYYSIIHSFIARKLFKPKTKIFRFKTNWLRYFRYPNKNLRKLVHYGGTLADVTHASYALGYKKIVLVGIDLYDRRYFWLDYDETHGHDKGLSATKNDLHKTGNSTVRLFKKWLPFFEKNGVELYVWNPKSLLTECLPVYKYKG